MNVDPTLAAQTRRHLYASQQPKPDDPPVTANLS